MTANPTEVGALPELVVLDTNIVLDLWVFGDATADALQAALSSGAMHWIATPAMREELVRVLDYPQIVKSLAHHGKTPDSVLLRFAESARLVNVALKAPVACKDPDDQKFIDLAVAHRAQLFSKDRAVLCMAKRLLALGVIARAAL